MFGHNKKEKVISPKKQLRIEHKQAKLELKKQAKDEKASKEVEQVATSAGKKAISRLAIAGSRIVGSAVAFLGAAAYNSFVVSGLGSHTTMLYSGATIGASLLAAAPYARSVARTNKSLLNVDNKLTQVDEAIGSQQQLVSDAIAGFEQASQNPQVSQADIAEIKSKVAELHAKMNSEPSAPQVVSSEAEQPKSNVHVAQKPASNSHIAK